MLSYTYVIHINSFFVSAYIYIDIFHNQHFEYMPESFLFYFYVCVSKIYTYIFLQ